MFDFERVRKFCVRRTEALWPLCFRLSIVGVLISVVIAILFSLCAKSSLTDAIGLGLLGALPMLFIFWLPFVVALFIVEITRQPEFNVALPRVISESSLIVPEGCLPLPFSPPRFRLA